MCCRSICTTKKAKWTCIIIILLPFLIHLTNLFQIQTEVQWVPCGVGYVVSATETKFGRTIYTDIIVDMILNLIFQIFIPYGVVVISNAVLIGTLFKAMKTRRELTGRKNPVGYMGLFNKGDIGSSKICFGFLWGRILKTVAF